jgi:drug/metabolite transporter superfamily protein YnfA
LNSSSNEDLDDDDNKNDKVDTNTAKTYNDNERIGISQLSMIDPILVYADIFAVVIACQLMGLIDVLNDDTFWRNGGWFQPIVIDSSSTLPIFLRRVATDSVCYILTTFVVIRGSYEIHTALRSSHTIFRMMISSILIFTFARLGTIFVQILFDTQGVDINDFVGFFINHSGQIVEILRESYCIALTTTSVRLGLSKFLNLS